MASLVKAVYDYLSVQSVERPDYNVDLPGSNANIVSRFLSGASKRKSLQQELVEESGVDPNDKDAVKRAYKAAEAQVRRWVNLGTGKQSRGVERMKKPTRFKLVRVVLKRLTPVHIKASGTIGYNAADMRHRTFTVDSVLLDDLLAILTAGAAGYTESGNMSGFDGEESACNILTGCYFDTTRPRKRPAIEDEAGKIIAYAPYDDTLGYSDDVVYTITKQKKES